MWRLAASHTCKRSTTSFLSTSFRSPSLLSTSFRSPSRLSTSCHSPCYDTLAVDTHGLDLKAIDIGFENPRKLQIVSNVHLERYTRGLPFPTIAKHGHDLALLGDIGEPHSISYRWFLRQCSQEFENVFVVMGNHDYYDNSGSRTMNDILTKARAVCSDFSNVFLLDRSTFDLTKNTRILGTTLWGSIDAHSVDTRQDLNMIHTVDGKLTNEHYCRAHGVDVSWLKKELEHCRKHKKNAVVLTHHGPCQNMVRHLFRHPAIAYASGQVYGTRLPSPHLSNPMRCATGSIGNHIGYREDVMIEIP